MPQMYIGRTYRNGLPAMNNNERVPKTTDDETHRATSSYTLTDAELLGQALILAVAQARNVIVGQRELFA